MVQPPLQVLNLFQSTQPEWAATHHAYPGYGRKSISIHAARVGCDGNAESGIGADDNFNPRSPSGLRRAVQWWLWRECWYFNPRSPSGLRRQNGKPTLYFDRISIHAARVGCDGRAKMELKIVINGFQSTQPEWAATFAMLAVMPLFSISIHAARVGCDVLTTSFRLR